jgi:hypothetical protein
MAVNWMTALQFPEQRNSFLHCYIRTASEAHLVSFQVDSRSFGLREKWLECEVDIQLHAHLYHSHHVFRILPLDYSSYIIYPYTNYLLTL